LERLTKNLKGAFHIFYSVLIMAPLNNSLKDTQENEIVPVEGDAVEFPEGLHVWGRLESSWWPGT